MAGVTMVAGNGTGVTTPEAFVFVSDNTPTIGYPSPSAVNITDTSARTVAYLYNNYTAGEIYFEIGEVPLIPTYGPDKYPDKSDHLAIDTQYNYYSEIHTGWMGGTPNTLHHWRMCFVTAANTKYCGAEQFFTSLAAPPAGPRYTLSISSTTGGSTSAGGEYPSGTSVSATATPNPGYVFSGWNLDNSTTPITANPYQIAMDASHALRANFSPSTTITGGANLDLFMTAGSASVIVGNTVTYSLTVSNKGPDPALGVILKDTLPAGVTFTSATSIPGSCSEASGIVICNLGAILNGASSSVTIVATPGAAGAINNLAHVSSDTPDSVTLDNDAATSITVNVASDVNTYTINTTADANGSISPISLAVKSGSNQSFTINSNSGYHVVDVKVDGTSLGAVTTHTFNNVTANHTISANFAANSANTFTVNPLAGRGGSINPATQQIVSNNGSKVFTVTPNSGLSIVSVTGCGGALSGNTFTTGAITADCTVTAIFDTPPTLTLSTLADLAITNNVTLNVAGTVIDNTAVTGLTINGAVVVIKVDGSFSHAVSLMAGPNTITTTATDSAGNTTTDSRTITLDQAAPTLTITAPADNSKSSTAVTAVTGTVDKTATVSIKVNNGASKSATMTGNNFTATVNLAAGLNTIDITATDLVGNVSTAKRTMTFNAGSALAVTEPNQDIKTDQQTINLTGTVADTSTSITITITVDGQSFSPKVSNGTFSQTITFTVEKSYAITVTATDTSGNATTVQRNVVYAKIGELDGGVGLTIDDALRALRFTLGLDTPDAVNFSRLNVAPIVNGVAQPDSKVDIEDVVAILRKIVGLGW